MNWLSLNEPLQSIVLHGVDVLSVLVDPSAALSPQHTHGLKRNWKLFLTLSKDEFFLVFYINVYAVWKNSEQVLNKPAFL